MKIRNNWKLWGTIFIGFIALWVVRTSYLTYRMSVERATSRYEIDFKTAPAPPPPPQDKDRPLESKKSPPMAAPAPDVLFMEKEPIDVWSWVVKIGGGLSGLKTLLDIIDKFRKNRK